MLKRPGMFTPNTTPSKIATWTVNETTPRKRGPSLALTASPTKQIQKRSAFSRELFKTYIFFDLECTGLIKNDDTRNLQNRPFERSEEHYNILNQLCIETRKDELPYITEMSFMAISSETFDDLKAERMKNLKWNEENPDNQKDLAKYVPANTHTRQINPVLMSDGEWASYERFRLADRRGVLVHSKKDCQRNNSFKEEWPAVIQFFNSFPKPALLVGHNAIKYDFRVIYGELQRNDLLEDYGIPPDVYFVDSYWMAKKVEETIVKELVTVCKYIKFPKIPKAEVEDVLLLAEESCNETILEPSTSADDHPANILDWDKFSVSLRKRIRKEGFVRTTNGWTYKHGDNKFGLAALYEQLVGGKYSAHYAQQDTEALMHVCLSYGNEFTQYLNENASAVPF
ncbi:Protein CBG19000 [Caenorhabditis briggsae]|uniref:Exonuclease domain-containing protein n=2 Tax=Caenorhabditis briggsae TaxID=6238 RepID=A0AAE9F759_CAEBR|nr:Protein CBG19000 [Caenorhabditis briggsae]ULT90355.1 hypothetical protein L3Y34_008597 [Caenorhabditis briggsae]UMM36137.1 hypothetical protein L5515_008435 [Caenorhabditis briggsae]CAP36319.2 Protein CBG19000 [Caenorhabditis briggsae]